MVFVVLVFLSQRADAYGRELTDNEAMTAERIIEKLSILRNKKNDVSLKRMFDGDTDYDITKYEQKLLSLGVGLCQVLVGKFPYLFLLSLFFYFFVSQISPGYALNRYFSLVAKYKIS